MITVMKNDTKSNIEILYIIVAAWNLSMTDANAICAKSDLDINDGMVELMSFISGKDVSINEILLSKNQYANDAIDYYNTYKKLSQNVKYTKWKSLKRNSLIRTYGMVFDIYLSNGFNTDFLKHLPFFKMSERQFAKLFIKLKQKILI